MTRRMQSRTFIKTYSITYNLIWVCSGKSRRGRMKCLRAITQSENHRFCRKQKEKKNAKPNTQADLCSADVFPFFHHAQTCRSVWCVSRYHTEAFSCISPMSFWVPLPPVTQIHLREWWQDDELLWDRGGEGQRILQSPSRAMAIEC